MFWWWHRQKYCKNKIKKTFKAWNGMAGKTSWPSQSLLQETKTFPHAKHAPHELSLLGLKLMTVAFAAFDKTNNAMRKMVLCWGNFFFLSSNWGIRCLPGIWGHSQTGQGWTSHFTQDENPTTGMFLQGLKEILLCAVWKLSTKDKTICLRGDFHPFSGGISYALVLTAVDKGVTMEEHDVLCCCLKAEG